MKKILFLLILLPGALFAQESKSPDSAIKSQIIPVQAQYSESFSIKNVYFNKNLEINGKGEILEVVFEIRNKTDDPMDFYIYVIASYEKTEKSRSSFETPIPEKERMRSFVPYPFNLENFQYPVSDSKGNQVKDSSGKAKMKYIKFPRDPKQGINPATNDLYHLENKIIIRTTHLSKFRNNYFFFNNVSIMVFNKEGVPQYKQSYELIGYRR